MLPTIARFASRLLGWDEGYGAQAAVFPDRSQPEWIRGAKSRVVLQGTGDWLMSMLPEDLDATISKRLKKTKPEEDEPASGQRSERERPPTFEVHARWPGAPVSDWR